LVIEKIHFDRFLKFVQNTSIFPNLFLFMKFGIEGLFLSSPINFHLPKNVYLIESSKVKSRMKVWRM